MAPPSGSRNLKATRDSYHHMIPRFILVRFQSTPHMSKKQRDKIFAKTKKDSRKIQFYELATSVLEERSFSDVYGVKNLYRDASSMQDVDELEDKLAILEQDAKVVIDGIHDGIGSGTASMLRSELETLRKFLFLMHYRRDTVSGAYFDSDHPENTGSRGWTEKMKLETRRGKDATPTDLWLYFLRYYLDTPHNTLLDEGEQWMHSLLSRGLDNPMFHPDDDQSSAAGAYWKQGGGFLLGIWCAAKDQEFILTHNGFGLWEGIAPPLDIFPEIHRLFVLSPQIAIVLRSNFYEGHGRSNLTDIEMKRPSRQSAVSGPGNPFALKSESDQLDPSRMSAYRAGPGQKDRFTFLITRLTPRQTDEFNFVLLRNAKPDVGGLSFRDARLCGEMINRFCAGAHEPWDIDRATIVRPLGLRLTGMSDEKNSHLPPIYGITGSLREKLRIMSYALRLHHCGRPSVSRTVVDCDPTSILISLLALPNASEYDRAYQLHTVLRDFSVKYGKSHDGLAATYSSISTHFFRTWLSKHPALEVELVPRDLELLPHLDENNSASFFVMISAWFTALLGRLPFGFGQGETPEDAATRLLGHAIYLGCVEKVLRKAPANLFAVTEQLGFSVCADQQSE